MGFRCTGSNSISKIWVVYSNDFVSAYASHEVSQGRWEMHTDEEAIWNFYFCYDKPILEEQIEEPIRVSLAE